MTAPQEGARLRVPERCEGLSGALPRDARFALVASDYHADVVQRLLDGAVEELERHGVSRGRVTVAIVPGAFELGLAARRLAESGRYAGVAVLGCVIRGGTPHFDYVCSEAARSVTLAQQATGVPIGVRRADLREPPAGDGACGRRGGQQGRRGRRRCRRARCHAARRPLEGEQSEMADQEDDDLTVWRLEVEVIAAPERAEELHDAIRALVADEELESLTRYAMDMTTWTRIERIEDEEEEDEDEEEDNGATP